jgi:hypothetical protein
MQCLPSIDHINHEFAYSSDIVDTYYVLSIAI